MEVTKPAETRPTRGIYDGLTETHHFLLLVGLSSGFDGPCLPLGRIYIPSSVMISPARVLLKKPARDPYGLFSGTHTLFCYTFQSPSGVARTRQDGRALRATQLEEEILIARVSTNQIAPAILPDS